MSKRMRRLVVVLSAIVITLSIGSQEVSSTTVVTGCSECYGGGCPPPVVRLILCDLACNFMDESECLTSAMCSEGETLIHCWQELPE